MRRLVWKLTNIVIFVVLILLCIPVQSGFATGETVRVGINLYDGFNNKQQNAYSGYNYDYLQRIAKYAGWNYEFVEGTWEQCLQWLASGEIDLLGTLHKTPERETRFRYGLFDYAYTATTVLAMYNNDELHTLESAQDLVVGIYAGSAAEACFEQKMEQLGLRYTTRYYATQEELMQALQDQKVDVILSDTLINPQHTKEIGSLSPQPLYFAVNPQRTDLAQQLDEALGQIRVEEPALAQTLREKYYMDSAKKEATFTEQERTYLEAMQSKTLRVAIGPDQLPIEGMSAKTGEAMGVTSKILRRISDQTGLKFAYTGTESFEQSKQLLEQSEVDLMTNYQGGNKAQGSRNSQSFLTASVVMVARKDFVYDPERTTTIVVDARSQGNVQYAKTQFPTGTFLYAENDRKALEAVQRGDADLFICNIYVAQEQLALHYRDLAVLFDTGILMRYYFEFAQGTPDELISVFNKCIYSISEAELRTILIESTTDSFANAGLSGEGVMFAVMTVLLTILLIIIVILFYKLRQNNRALQIKLEMERELTDIKTYRAIADGYYDNVLEADLTNNKMVSGKMQILTEQVPLSGMSYEECVKMVCEKIVVPEDQQIFLQTLDRHKLIDRMMMDRKESIFEYREQATDGAEPVWRRTMLSIYYSPTNGTIRLIAFIKDISEEKRVVQVLQEKAQKDSMTGLYNKKASQELVDQYLSQKGAAGVMFMVDIDNFKSINDSFGHTVGDLCIQKTAENLRRIFRPTDIIGRVGGDEFVIFMKGILDHDLIIKRARDVCDVFAQVEKQFDREFRFTTSIGIVVAQDGRQQYAELFRKADIALYDSKLQGKNTYTFYNGSMDQKDVLFGHTEIDSEQARLPMVAQVLTAHTMHILEETKDSEQVLSDVLSMVGSCFGVSRCYLVLHGALQAAWNREGIAGCTVPDFARQDTARFGADGVFLLRSRIEAEEKWMDILEGCAIHSVLQCALYDKHQHIVGYLGYDDCCEGNDSTTPDQVVTLQVIAQTLAAYLTREDWD